MLSRPWFVPLCLLLMAGCADSASDTMTSSSSQQNDPWAPLARYIDAREAEFEVIPQDRREELTALGEFVKAARDTGQAELIFICTHNSRRSHFGQVWAQVAAHHHGLDSLVSTYSGGTEATAMNERAVGALRRAGLDIHPAQLSENPKYAVHYAADRDPMVCFSKKYDDAEANPNAGFAAVMTCAQADRGCPIVYGSAARFSTPYVDPKVSDGTPEEVETYDERCAEIARDMLYAMSVAAR
jgi:protein-tyrosine-phosphatase